MQQLSCAVVDNLSLQLYQTPRPDDSSARSLPSCISSDHSAPSLRPFLSDLTQKDNNSAIRTADQELNKESIPFRQITLQLKGSLWPEIETIISKIANLQTELSSQRSKNRQLELQLEEHMHKIQGYEEEIRNNGREKEAQSKDREEVQMRIEALEELLESKQQLINEKSNTISEIQMMQVRKVGQLQDKIKKLISDQKEVNEKLRKANTQLQKERSANRDLKSEMLQKIQQLQSDKEIYLLRQIETLKENLSASKADRQLKLTDEIAELKSKVYQLSEEVKIKNIQMSLMERKKQQAINDALEKKEQEVKMQKSLYKSLQQKVAKMQQDSRNAKKKADPRQNKLLQDRRKLEEEIVLQLSPDVRQPASIL